jgi:hypothetical protein
MKLTGAFGARSLSPSRRQAVSPTARRSKMTFRSQSLAIDLEHALSVGRIVKVWKNVVRDGLRRQPIEDLHDFLDVHRNIEGFARRLRKDVLDGRYRPASPEFVHLEKRDGIPRRLAVPEAGDALLLQCLVEAIEPAIERAQPSKNAYYSRTHVPGSVEQVDGTFGYPWWILWPQFQDRIWKFTNTHPCVVVTDIANYFDSIPLAALRNTVAELGQFSENLLNFLFFLLESFCWRPYYIPSSGVGLPQINFDAPRLLATAYLFRIDRELDRATKGDFVRWMDDIDAGVASRQDGKRLLRDLETVLNSQGLRLNSGKSRILSAKEACEHFWVQENRYLTIVENSIANGVDHADLRALKVAMLERRYRRFERKRRSGNWDKVYKRYLKLFGLLKADVVEGRLSQLLEDAPVLRGAVLRYLQLLGPSARRLRIVENFLTSGHCEDEASLFEAVKCLVSWQLPANGSLVARMCRLAHSVARANGTQSPAGVAAAIWLLAKYGSGASLGGLLQEARHVWSRNSWAARQVAGVVPLVPRRFRTLVIETAAGHGLVQSLQVLANIFSLQRLPKLDRQLESYLSHAPRVGYPYPLQKVIVARSVLDGAMLSDEKRRTRAFLAKFIEDKRYRALLGLDDDGTGRHSRRANRALNPSNASLASLGRTFAA